MRWLLASELASSQGKWDIASKVEENHVGHDEKEAALISKKFKAAKIRTATRPAAL